MSKPEPAHEAFNLQWNANPPTHIIQTIGRLRAWLDTCPNAQTLEAFSKRYKCTVWIPLPCKQWKCRRCAQQKIRTLSAKCRDAAPNRLLTLTIDPALWDNPRHAFDGTRRKVPELFKKLRQRFGEAEYLRVTELTRRGWPHYHALVRSPYLPHSVVKTLWHDLTGAEIVDLRQVKSHFQSYTYLVKYLSKMHNLGWTNRHVSHSRNFFPPADPPPDSGLDLTEFSIVESHPATLLYHQFRTVQITAIAYNAFALDPQSHFHDSLAPPDRWPSTPEETPQCQTNPSPKKPSETSPACSKTWLFTESNLPRPSSD